MHVQSADAVMNDESVRSGMHWLARTGYATKGFLYFLLGALSVQAAVGVGAPKGSKETIEELGQQPFGTVMLTLTAIGLGAYALWRAVQAALDPENVGNDAKGIAKRIGYGASAAAHVSLCVATVQLAIGAGGEGGGDKKVSYVAEMMTSTVGQVVVGVIGLVLIGFGLQQLKKAKTTEFSKTLDLSDMGARGRKVAIWTGRLGLAARGVVFPIMGVFLVRAALTTDASKVRGVQGALREVSQSTFGDAMLLVVAIGLAAYGIFQLVQARYRRIPAG